ncbi:hypothetical protein DSL64_08150 [Dyadobacter luteus]|uniref:Uncharacterized protein n=1 Tax=Dyadobacter luteus TaxID=2259619 RepID=A0A3D8YED5_9BACT|nr:hypothetical protein DSL64_08150 [Dyadobacter luteus]
MLPGRNANLKTLSIPILNRKLPAKHFTGNEKIRPPSDGAGFLFFSSTLWTTIGLIGTDCD